MPCRFKRIGIGQGFVALALMLPTLLSAQCLDLQGHRGARGKFPENTLPAFKHALEQGVTTLEADLVMTRDRVLLVGHDPVLNTDLVRDVTGAWLTAPAPEVFSLTVQQVRQLDVGRIRPGSRMAGLWPQQQSLDGTRMPFFNELLQLAARAPYKVELNVETKLSPLQPNQSPEAGEFARAVIDEVRGAGLLDRTIIQSFDWRTLQEVKRLEPRIRTACLTIDTPNFSTLRASPEGTFPWQGGLQMPDYASVAAMVKAARCDIWSMFWRNVDAKNLADAKALGLKVVPWTVNELSDMKALAALGVDGLITDYPDRWVRAVQEDSALRPVCRLQ